MERSWFDTATMCSVKTAKAVLENGLLTALNSSLVVDSTYNDMLESMFNQLMAGSVERIDIERRLSELLVY